VCGLLLCGNTFLPVVKHDHVATSALGISKPKAVTVLMPSSSLSNLPAYESDFFSSIAIHGYPSACIHRTSEITLCLLLAPAPEILRSTRTSLGLRLESLLDVLGDVAEAAPGDDETAVVLGCDTGRKRGEEFAIRAE
jgi:hypothetical protein